MRWPDRFSALVRSAVQAGRDAMSGPPDDAARDDAERAAALAELAEVASERFRRWLAANPDMPGDPQQAVAFMAGWLACADWGSGA